MDYKTADLCDAHSDKIQIATPIGFKDYGGRKKFSGAIHTIKCFEDHSMVETVLKTDGTGKVLVVDGGGSLHCALMGDRLAGIGTRNNWNGIVIYGCIRDSVEVSLLNFGVKALNTYSRTKETATPWPQNIDVHFADTTFTPGHFVYCDEDGIIVAETELVL